VLDLRDDPGGYITAAVDVCDMLISSGVIVTVRRRGGQIGETYAATGRGTYTDFPIAVLVNDMSASAAEIVAACLQDNHRATIVGERSYGKGSVQEVIDLEKGCGAMKITTASYWRPSGKSIQRPAKVDSKSNWGVSPDEGFKVAMDRQEQNRWREWRSKRDVFQSSAVNGAKNGAAKKDVTPFVDRSLVRAVEWVEKEAAKPQ
jgi:carboxyl-terminal processing protease